MILMAIKRNENHRDGGLKDNDEGTCVTIGGRGSGGGGCAGGGCAGGGCADCGCIGGGCVDGG